MTKHTPTPWQALPDENGNETYVVGPKDQAVADCMMGYGVTDDANAAFIVKAVNNHEALVNHLRHLATVCCDEDALRLTDSLTDRVGSGDKQP